MHRLFFFIFFLHHLVTVTAQGEHDNVWVSGYGNFAPNFGGNRIDFSDGEPSLAHFPLPYKFGIEVPCSISDGDGNL